MTIDAGDMLLHELIEAAEFIIGEGIVHALPVARARNPDDCRVGNSAASAVRRTCFILC